jgi:hypothetical protein
MANANYDKTLVDILKKIKEGKPSNKSYLEDQVRNFPDSEELEEILNLNLLETSDKPQFLLISRQVWLAISLFISAITLLILVMVFIQNKNSSNPIHNETITPFQSVQVTTEPIIILIPTNTPTPTLTVFPTITPTLLPTSTFQIIEAQELTPAVPVNLDASKSEEVWSIPAEYDPKLTNKNGSNVLPFLKASVTYPAIADWNLVNPGINQPGYFGVYLLDFNGKYTSQGWAQYNVNVGPNQSYTNKVKLLQDDPNYFKGLGVKNLWVPLGIYNANYGDALKVGVEMTSEGEYLPVANMLIVHYSESDQQIINNLVSQTQGKQIITILDQGDQPDLQKAGWKTEMGAGFGGDFVHSDGNNPELKLDWRMPADLPDGSYEIWAYIPKLETGLGTITYNLDTYNKTLMQSDFRGEWVKLFDYQANKGKIGWNVDIKMSFPDKLGVLDALAILKDSEK